MRLSLFLVSILLLSGIAQAHSFEEEFNISRNAYPELDSVDVQVIEKSFNGRMMVSRPSALSFFKSRETRVYEIWVNNDFSKNDGYLIYNTTSNATVGLLSHELAHILEYEKMNRFQIISMGILYSLSDSYKKKVEHRIDDLAISKGMGLEIYEFTSLVLEDENSPERYKDYRRKIYYDPNKILELIS